MLFIYDLLALLGLDTTELDVDPNYVETDSQITINASQKVISQKERLCPYCSSNNVKIKDRRLRVIKNSITKVTLKPIIVNLERIRYVCKECGKSYTPELNLVQARKNISRKVEQYVYEKTKEAVSFTSIAHELNISVSSVRNIFNDTVKIGRSALSTAISIDEKHFKTEFGSYVLVISNPFNGKILDVLPSRRMEMMNYYFSHISLNERNNVKYFTSDMYKPYKTIKERFFPKALHIIDHFHIARLFTNAIQIIRKQCMRNENKGSREYEFLKKNRKIFLINPYGSKGSTLDTEIVRDNKYFRATYDDLIKRTINAYPNFNEIYSIFLDYCRYLQIGIEDSKLEKRLSFIIDRCLNSTQEIIRTIGETMYDFYDEILNFFESKNSYKLSNAVAEACNNNIDKIISASYGLKDFATFKKRVLHTNKK